MAAAERGHLPLAQHVGKQAAEVQPHGHSRKGQTLVRTWGTNAGRLFPEERST